MIVGTLTGMTEHSGTVSVAQSAQSICQSVITVANVIQVPSSEADMFYFAAKTVAYQTDTLVTIQLTTDKASITVNCEKMVIGSMLLKNIKTALSNL